MKTVKKGLSLLLALLMVISIIPFAAPRVEAATVIASGDCGESGFTMVYWELDDDGVLTVFGEGPMKTYARGDWDGLYTSSRPWEDYISSITKVVVKDGVTSVGSYAFSRCENLRSIELADSVEAIGKVAFSFCEQLTTINLPESLTYLSGFDGCIGLTHVDVPKNVEVIDDYAFQNCRSLVSVTLPEGLEKIGAWGFAGCIALKSIQFPKSLTRLEDLSFWGCTSLESIRIPENVDYIGVSAFKDCTDLRSVTVPSSVSVIGESAFYNCSALSSVTFLGDAPEVKNEFGWGVKSPLVFPDATATVSYPKNNSTWTNEKKARIGGENLQWIPYELTITTQPKTTYTKLNNTAKVTVAAKGDGLTYTWYRKNAGATKWTKSTVTDSTYSVKMTNTIKDRQIYCVVKDKYGNTVKSNTVYLRMAASITTQPKTTYTKLNNTLKVTVAAKGDGLTYTWYKKNVGDSGFTKSSISGASYSVKMTNSAKDRQIYCVVKDKYGNTVKSNTVYLRMAASITTQPKTTYTKLNNTAKVTVAAKGDGLTYTWYRKNAGATKWTKSTVTDSTYSVKMTNTIKDRQIYCVVKDKYGNTVKSNTVYLRMAASITSQPKTTTTKLGATAKVTVAAKGDGLTYTWYRKNAGATKWTKSTVTGATYSVKMTNTIKNRQVYCVVKDKYGNTVKSNTATLKMQ